MNMADHETRLNAIPNARPASAVTTIVSEDGCPFSIGPPKRVSGKAPLNADSKNMKIELQKTYHILPGKEGFCRQPPDFRVSTRQNASTCRPGHRAKRVNEPPEQIIHFINREEVLPGIAGGVLEKAGYKTRSYSSVEEILEAQNTVLRGCFILDVHLPQEADGLELQAELIRRNNHLPIIFLTDHGDISMSVQATKSGAFDFLTRQTTQEDLLATVEAAMKEEACLWDVMQKSQVLRKRWDNLTQRERHVFCGVVSGMTNKQIGGKVGSTERTIRAHRASMMQKMAVHSVAELVHQAQELGISIDTV